MVVWNYDLRCIQVMQINQKSIQKAVKALADNVAWGTPLDYDIVINKSGEGLETEYNVMPCPKTPVDDYIKESREWVNSLVIDLDTLNYSRLIEEKYLKHKAKSP